jgi:steroid 5-alpha reductase family enzyme
VIENPWILLLMGTFAVVAVMFLLWLLSLRNDNFSYVDIGWSINFAVIGVLYAALAPGYPLRRWLFAAMFSVHGLRLGWHLSKRIIGQPEEGRYVHLRKVWGRSGNLKLKFLAFFQLQAALNAFLTLPLLIVCFNTTTTLHALEIAGVVLFAIGLIGESTADAQLAAFKRSSAVHDAVCDVGLWRYSRHPNYFFEWLIWIAYAVFALASDYGWVALIMPALMLHFLLNVTGVKATEEQALRSKGERYRRYQARTSGFVPWFPKRVDT